MHDNSDNTREREDTPNTKPKISVEEFLRLNAPKIPKTRQLESLKKEVLRLREVGMTIKDIQEFLSINGIDMTVSLIGTNIRKWRREKTPTEHQITSEFGAGGDK